MHSFSEHFIDDVAMRLKCLIDESDPSKPYAAILFAVDEGKDLETQGRLIAGAHNTELTTGNPTCHAEINVLNMAVRILFEAKCHGGPPPKFYFFVNTRPCPKCTAAILDSPIRNVYFFYDNNYERDTSETLINATRQKIEGEPLTFEELQSHWKERFQEWSTPHRGRSTLVRPALIIIDMQNDFLAKDGYYGDRAPRQADGQSPRPESLAGKPESRTFVPRDPPLDTTIDNVVAMIADARRKRWPIAHIGAAYGHAYAIKNRSLQRNPAKADYPCKPQTWGAHFIPKIFDEMYRAPNLADEIVIYKHTYDGFFQTELLFFLQQRHIKTVVVAGAETHVCVLRTAESAVLNQFNTIILEDCVWSANKTLAESALQLFGEAYGDVISRAKLV